MFSRETAKEGGWPGGEGNTPHGTLCTSNSCKPCSGNNNYDLKRPYFCINLKGCIFFLPSSLRGLTYPKYLHKSTVTVNMDSTIQSSISYQVRVKTEGEMSA